MKTWSIGSHPNITGRTIEEHVMAALADNDPRHHTRRMRERLEETMNHLREDIGKVDEPQFRAMFETSAEVLGGLIKAFRDYEQKSRLAPLSTGHRNEKEPAQPRAPLRKT